MDLETPLSEVRGSLLLSALAVLGMALACAAPEEPPIPADAQAGRNVILLSFDALRADALGVYGSTRGASPKIDAWAESAIVFENAYATTPVTPTSLSSVLSGRPPLEVFRDYRFDGEGSLAPTFAAAGYATGAFLHNPQLVARRGFGLGFQTLVVEEREDGRFDGELLAKAISWMTRQERPFLAWIHLLDPHTRWDRAEHAERFYDRHYRGPYLEGGPGRVLREHDEKELARLVSLYTGEVFLTDRNFGMLVQALSQGGLLERSILVVTSDHGEGLMEHGLLQHAQVYEEDLRIPLIVGVPGLAGGRRIATPVTQLDLFPTLASLAGVELPRSLPGHDLTTALPGRREVVGVSYSLERFRQASLLTDQGVKLLVECGASWQGGEPRRMLFDLGRDPDEHEDLSAARADEAAALESRLWQVLGLSGCDELTMSREGGRTEGEGLDADTVRRLKALGYMQGEP